MLHKKHIHGAIIQTPKGPKKMSTTCFVKDTNTATTEDTQEYLIQKATADAQLWTDMLHLTGRKLNLAKCFFYVILWQLSN